MTMFVITLDTEADNEWARPRRPETLNARFVPRFHELCLAHGFKITYLLTLEMAEDAFLADYLRPRLARGECEVGAHLHPWSTPPIEAITDDDFHYQPYPFEYPEDLQRRKLETLVAAIERNYGVRPVSYKAGRWGLDGVHARLLDELGFRVDTSVCPGISWRRNKGHPAGCGGPDFDQAPFLPYRLSSDDVCRPGTLSIWELPPTIVFYSPLGRYVPGVRSLYRRYRKVRRAFDRLHLGSLWLRPFPYMTAARLTRVAKIARRAGAPVLNLTFHSSELMPGGSPYNPTAESIEDLYRRLEGFFRWLDRQRVEAMTLGEAQRRIAALHATAASGA